MPFYRSSTEGLRWLDSLTTSKQDYSSMLCGNKQTNKNKIKFSNENVGQLNIWESFQVFDEKLNQ